MSHIDKLRRILQQFSIEYAQGVLRNLRDDPDIQVSEEELQAITDIELQEENLTVNRAGEVFYLGEYQYLHAYKEIEDSVGKHDQNLPDYQCRLVKKSDKYYVLEIISKKLLETRDFYTFDEWHAYLKRLHTTGIIELENCLELSPTGRVVTIYGVPEGYTFLDEVVRGYTDIFQEPSTVLSLLQQLNLACIQTARTTNRTGRTRTFSFVTTHSHFLLVNDQLEPILCALGASLTYRPVYVSATRHGKMTYPSDMGFSAYSLSIGFLLFELLSDQCPIQQIDQNISRHLSESPYIDQYPKHIHAFIKRSTQVRTDWRYPSFNRIAEDLEHITAYLEYICQHALSELDAEIIQFVDFIRLRFRSYELNPQLRKQPLETSSIWMLNSIAEDFNSYFNRNNRFHYLHDTLIENDEFHHSISKNRAATPLTQHLIKYFYFWSALCHKCIAHKLSRCSK